MSDSDKAVTGQTETLCWIGKADGYLKLIDQTLLPTQLIEIECRDVESVWEAIKSLRVRGAPAIGIAAAYGVVIGLQKAAGADDRQLGERLDNVAAHLATSRPTAVNLFWALNRIQQRAQQSALCFRVGCLRNSAHEHSYLCPPLIRGSRGACPLPLIQIPPPSAGEILWVSPP